MPPKVSVLMPVYNAAPYLGEAIESILNQILKDFEFIIIDDNSTDNSYEIARSYQDKRIRLYKNETNLRVAETLNRGLKLAQGEYVARMDADDISLPKRLAQQVKFMDSNPDIAVAGSWVRVIGDTHEYVWKYESDPEKLRAKLFFNCSVAHPTVIMRRRMLLDNNFWYKNMGVEDFELWARICDKLKISNLNKVLLLYRVNPSQSSNTFATFHQEGLNKVLVRQIQKLKIEAGEKEIAIHRLASSFHTSLPLDSIKEMAEWLGRVRLANDKVAFYNRRYFAEIISNLWYGAIIQNRRVPKIWDIFVSSIATDNLSSWQKFKFILKFIISRIWQRRVLRPTA